jgi:hypothetical protein
MQFLHHYSILEKARQISGAPELSHLASRKYLGIPVADEIRKWIREQPERQPLLLDLSGVQTMNGSVALEIGPLTMEVITNSTPYEQHYPIFGLADADLADSLALIFEGRGMQALGVVRGAITATRVVTPIAQEGEDTMVVLGALTTQNEQILKLAREKADLGSALTSDQLESLDFLAHVSAAARSKRLTELYARRLLAFRENPSNPKERLFYPPWKL